MINNTDAEVEDALASPSLSKRHRRWIYRLLSMMLFPLALGLLNFLCYLCGFGIDTSLVVRSPRIDHVNEFVLNRDVDAAYWNSVDLNGPEQRPFTIPKPEDTIRIVVAGASSIEGFPWATSLTIPRQIEIILSRQLNGHNVEVLNAGIVGITSFCVSDLVRQALVCQPDAIVVYTGHNEFYGPGGVSSRASAAISGTYSLMVGVRRFRLPQIVLRGLTPAPDPADTLTQLLARDLLIPYDGVAFRKASTLYRGNLERIAAVGTNSDVPIVLCSPACNLRHQSPIQSVPGVGLSDLQCAQRDELLDQVDGCLDDEMFEAGLLAARTAQSLDPDYALTSYRLAQCLEGLGRSAEAYHYFSRARDLDGCRFRAPACFAELAREVAREHAMSLVDVEQAMVDRAGGGAPGAESFVEHVHFNLEAMWDVSTLIARELVRCTSDTPWLDSRLPTTAERDEQLGLTEFDILAGLSIVQHLLGQPPLSAAPDASINLDRGGAQIYQVLKTLNRSDQDEFRALVAQRKTNDVLQDYAQVAMGDGRTADAIRLCRLRLRRTPWQTNGYLLLAECLVAAGQIDQAVIVVDRGMQLAADGDSKRLGRYLEALR